ncbi:MAG: outer membrane protein [Legionellales bacterium]
MKQFIQPGLYCLRSQSALLACGIISSMVLSTTSFALNPMQGPYAGVLVEISHGSTNYQTQYINNGTTYSGAVDSNPIGGGGGANLGFRIQNFRIEAEALYNYNGTSSVTVGDCTIRSPKTSTPSGTCPAALTNAALGFNGSTTTMYGFVNGYYDFLTYGNDAITVPYLGIGLGGARVRNSVNFVNTNTSASIGNSVYKTSTAIQGIMGLSFFIDDYAWLGIDYRYTSTYTVNNLNSARVVLNAINFNLNCAFGG